MEDVDAVDHFAALAHPTRLRVFRTLIAAGPAGVGAGRLAEQLGVSPSNLSAHLSTLSHAKLLTMRADGRARIYAVDLERVAALVDFLVADCCKGHPEVCSPIVKAMDRAC
ncbi:MAG: metalloregulator ArsR/SmtB family transcription factor [Oceanicaulis sp.]